MVPYWVIEGTYPIHLFTGPTHLKINNYITNFNTKLGLIFMNLKLKILKKDNLFYGDIFINT